MGKVANPSGLSGRVYRSISFAAALSQLCLPVAARADLADEGWGDLGYSKSTAEVESIPTSVEAEGADAYHAVEPSPEAVAANNGSVTTESLSTTRSSAQMEMTAPENSAPVPAPIDNEAAARAETLSRPKNRRSDAAAGLSAPGATSTSSAGTGRSFGRISTTRNTYGVMTEENPGTLFYVAPYGGMTSLMGNTTVDASPRYALGAQAGLLLTSNFFVGLSYTYSEQSLSGLRNNVTNGYLSPQADVFALKSNHIEVGGKLFFLGRESRVRPFFGGGFGWGKNYLNYTAANLQALSGNALYLSDFTISQFDSYGELGAEIAITRAVVVNAAFRLRGVLSNSTSAPNAQEAAKFDDTKVIAGNSLSRSASYTIGAGLGIYF